MFSTEPNSSIIIIIIFHSFFKLQRMDTLEHVEHLFCSRIRENYLAHIIVRLFLANCFKLTRQFQNNGLMHYKDVDELSA